jgi:hypothetical protein
MHNLCSSHKIYRTRSEIFQVTETYTVTGHHSAVPSYKTFPVVPCYSRKVAPAAFFTDTFLRGFEFKFLPGHRLLCLRTFVTSLTPSNGPYLELGHDRCLAYPFHSFVTLLWVFDRGNGSVVKEPQIPVSLCVTQLQCGYVLLYSTYPWNYVSFPGEGILHN